MVHSVYAAQLVSVCTGSAALGMGGERIICGVCGWHVCNALLAAHLLVPQPSRGQKFPPLAVSEDTCPVDSPFCYQLVSDHLPPAHGNR